MDDLATLSLYLFPPLGSSLERELEYPQLVPGGRNRSAVGNQLLSPSSVTLGEGGLN